MQDRYIKNDGGEKLRGRDRVAVWKFNGVSLISADFPRRKKTGIDANTPTPDAFPVPLLAV